MNATLGSSRLSDSELNETFEVWWPKLEDRLGQIGALTTSAPPIRPDRELLEEILEIIRSQASRTTQGKVALGLKPRLLSTLDWSPEDAALVTDFYETLKRGAGKLPGNKKAEELLSRIARDQDYASKLLVVLKDSGPTNPADVLQDSLEEDENLNS